MFLLRVSLIGFGLVFCSVYWLFQLDPLGGWAWTPPQSEYQVMIVGIYMVFGLMMIFQASRDPLKHVLFIRFVIYRRYTCANYCCASLGDFVTETVGS